MKKLLTLLFFTTAFLTFSQEALQVDLKVQDFDDKIDDVQAEAIVKGGVKPYRYIWSKAGVNIYTSVATGLSEGDTVSVTVIDAANNQITAKGFVPAESVPEHFNNTMKPAVKFLQDILFHQVFADTVKVPNNILKAPFALDESKKDYFVKECW